jgi:hypothetical protein
MFLLEYFLRQAVHPNIRGLSLYQRLRLERSFAGCSQIGQQRADRQILGDHAEFELADQEPREHLADGLPARSHGDTFALKFRLEQNVRRATPGIELLKRDQAAQLAVGKDCPGVLQFPLRRHGGEKFRKSGGGKIVRYFVAKALDPPPHPRECGERKRGCDGNIHLIPYIARMSV